MQIFPSTLLMPCLRLVVAPVATFCVRHAIKIQDVIECLKLELVEASKRELSRSGTKITQSRLSILTGLRRREVLRLESDPSNIKSEGSLITKVLGRWRDDKRFHTKGKTPKTLSFGTVDCEFNKLVQLVSSDLNPATVLFELERAGAVEKSDKGLSLKSANFVPRGDPLVAFDLLAKDTNDLMCTVESNTFHNSPLPHHHLRTEYDHVRPEGVEQLKQWFLREGHAFHLKAREQISQYDQDVNPDPNFSGTTVRVVFGSYSAAIEEKEKP